MHRVTDVPDTEKNGRMQTATASVAVLPEATEVKGGNMVAGGREATEVC